MLHLTILLPLAIGGVAGAVWREYKKINRVQPKTLSLPNSTAAAPVTAEAFPRNKSKEFDDVGELHHYQHVSWYALAFAISGSLFYAPVMLVSIPLLSYNAYHFVKTIRHSDTADQKSPMAIFEMVGIAGTLVTGRPVAASILMVFSFGMRKLLLQAGNIAHNVGFSQAYNPKLAKVWVLHDGVEVEASVADLQEGDIIVFHANDLITVTGKVFDGTGTVSQYSLRKKMKSIFKQKGDKVFPFTRLESGHLYVQPDY